MRCPAPVLAAESHAEMAEMLRDLPKDLPDVGSSGTPSSFNGFGDVKLKGRWRLGGPSRAVRVLGDVRLDLREAVCSCPEVRIEGFTVSAVWR